jgi:hypothetical protein
MIPKTQNPVNLGLTLQVKWSGGADFLAVAHSLMVFGNTAAANGFQVPGDWQPAINYFSSFPKRMDVSLERAHRQIAVMFAEDLRGAWNTQSLIASWTPLDPAYLADKIKKKLDRRTLIRTQEALKSIGVRFLANLELEVGVTAVADDGTPYMLVQEFGSRDGTIPARPLAGQVFYQNESRYVDVIVNAVNIVLNGGTYPDHAAGAIA